MRISVLAFLLAASCSGGAPEAIDDGLVAVVGRSILVGAPRPPRRVVERNCGVKHEPLRDESELVDPRSRGLRNVFVVVTEGLSPGPHPVPEEPVEIRAKDCVYRPRVLGLRAGQELVIANDGVNVINAHVVPRRSREMNTNIQVGKSRMLRLSPEVMVPVRNDINPWMLAYVGVVDHPYFAVTGADGTFKLPGLPPGRYRIAAWHEVRGQEVVTVDVAPGMKPVEFAFGRTN